VSIQEAGNNRNICFGAKFVAIKVRVEMLRGLHYKLHMMGIAISGPNDIYGDNMSVIHNTQRPESMLKKKSNAICYHDGNPWQWVNN